jgi:hypothetical protein
MIVGGAQLLGSLMINAEFQAATKDPAWMRRIVPQSSQDKVCASEDSSITALTVFFAWERRRGRLQVELKFKPKAKTRP